MDLMISVALIELATSGDPARLQSIIGGEIVYGLATDAGVLEEGEHYAPPALEVDGTIYRMVAPGKTTDNFIIQTGDLLVRLDAGVSEGDHLLRVVAATPLTGTAIRESKGESLWKAIRNRLGVGSRN